MTVNILDPAVADMIAAGEVVERPASVVKELVENSIDACSTSIKVEITGGGISFIRIIDNGCGMLPKDALTAFKKHATSKISTKEDLFKIHTLGFRGEALPSIAAVSKVTLITKIKNETEGCKIEIDGGKLILNEAIGSVDGTILTVKNLFYNTPARLKFLKSEQTESGVILDYMQKLAVSHPEISFSLFINGRQSFFTPGNNNLKDTIFSVYGRTYVDMTVNVDYNSDDIKIHGVIGKPIFSKSNRNLQIFFVNGRYVKSKLLQNILENAYKNCMLISRYPICWIFIDIDSSVTDINVHPNKLAIKFSDDKKISNVFLKALTDALFLDDGRVEIDLKTKPESSKVDNTVKPSEININKFIPKSEKHNLSESKSEAAGWTLYSSFGNNKNDKIKTDKKIELLSDNNLNQKNTYIKDNVFPVIHKINDTQITNNTSEKFVKSNNNQNEYINSCSQNQNDNLSDQLLIEKSNTSICCNDFEIVGEAFSTYIIVQKQDDILFVDKHALHERMNFEKLKTQKIDTQILLTPYIIDFMMGKELILLDNKDTLKNMGFDIEDFGGGSIAVREIPQILDIDDVDYILNKYIDTYSEFNSENNITDEFLYSIACKASIKSGMKTSEFEMKKLIQEYFNNETNLKYCPHGRPITFSLSKKSIEKQFKRIV